MALKYHLSHMKNTENGTVYTTEYYAGKYQNILGRQMKVNIRMCVKLALMDINKFIYLL